MPWLAQKYNPLIFYVIVLVLCNIIYDTNFGLNWLLQTFFLHHITLTPKSWLTAVSLVCFSSPLFAGYAWIPGWHQQSPGCGRWPGWWPHAQRPTPSPRPGSGGLQQPGHCGWSGCLACSGGQKKCVDIYGLLVGHTMSLTLDMTWKAVDLITSKTLCAVCEVWVYKERPVTECRHYGWVCALTATPTSLALCHCGQGAGLVPCRPGFKAWARWLLSPFPTRPFATSLLTTNVILKTCNTFGI